MSKKHKYTGPIIRVSVTVGPKGVRTATLQQRAHVDTKTGYETWEDVRPLTITPDGEIVLSEDIPSSILLAGVIEA